MKSNNSFSFLTCNARTSNDAPFQPRARPHCRNENDRVRIALKTRKCNLYHKTSTNQSFIDSSIDSPRVDLDGPERVRRQRNRSLKLLFIVRFDSTKRQRFVNIANTTTKPIMYLLFAHVAADDVDMRREFRQHITNLLFIVFFKKKPDTC